MTMKEFIYEIEMGRERSWDAQNEIMMQGVWKAMDLAGLTEEDVDPLDLFNYLYDEDYDAIQDILKNKLK